MEAMGVALEHRLEKEAVARLRLHGAEGRIIMFGTEADRKALQNVQMYWVYLQLPIYRTLQGHTNAVWSVCAVDGNRLASCSRDKSIKIWDTTSGACLQTLQGHTHLVTSVCALDGNRLASGACEKSIKVWDMTSGA